jgi:hypothetical protein
VVYDDIILNDRPSLRDDNIRAMLAAKLERHKKRGVILVKQFPTGQLTMRGLNAYLEQVESIKGIIPEVIILDYPDLMSYDAANTRAEIGKIYKDLRGIAVERNCFMVEASQVNRDAESAKLVTRKNTSEDFSKIFTSDVIITYSQTPGERKLGLARLHVDKCREDENSKAGSTFVISQAYAIGQFCRAWTEQVDREYWQMVKADDGSED